MTTLQLLLLTCAVAHSILLPSLASSDSAYPPPYGMEFKPAEEVVPVRREIYGGGRIIDISHRYHAEMPMFEGESGCGQILTLPKDMRKGEPAYNSEIKLPAHVGTHVDAPGHVFHHYFEAGFDVDTLDLDVLNGPALVVDVPRDKNITAEVMKFLNIPKGVRRVLFRTLNTDRRLMYQKAFDTSYVGFMKDGAQYLVDNTDIKLVGGDYLSIAAYDDLIPSHLVFLEGREHILVEGLKLDDVEPGIYDVHCLPLRLIAEVMKSLNIPKGVKRVLFRTLNADRRLMYQKAFDTSYVGFMKDGAQWLVDNTDIQLVGIDYLSVAAFADLMPSHLVFLKGREHILVEGLKLDDVQPGEYNVHCLPLRLAWL